MAKIAHTIALVLLAALLCPMNASAQKRKKTLPPAKQDTLTILTKQAEGGDATAQNTLANWYYNGKNVEKDYAKAAHWWALAAKQQNPDAVGNLALCYQLGRGLTHDSVRALGLYEKAIELGNKHIIPQHEKLAEGKKSQLFSAQLLYRCYSKGIGVQKDEEKADRYLAILAEAGTAEQKYNVALGYINRQKPDKAVPWLKKAAKDGNIGATFYLGRMMYRGTGISQDRKQGIELMAKAAEKELPGACLEMGKIYLAGDDVERDAEKGTEYLKKAAGVSSEAGWLLAMCYLKGEGVTQDYYLATQWIAQYAGSHKKELRQLLDDKNNQLFEEYLDGMHSYAVENDFNDAMESFKKVAKGKVAEGTTMQAVCLGNKNYAKYSEKKAVKLMEKAAATSALAQYYLSSMLFKGKGVEKDKERALELLKKAAEHGIAEAQCDLADRYMEGNLVAQDYVKAATLYLKAEAQHKLTPEAAKNLAKCYQLKVSSLPDLNNAKQRMEKLKAYKADDKLTELLHMVAD